MRKKKLKGKDSPDLRPVGARALKSAIDTLRPYLAESRVLDLYSGQGRFGLAAAEEGASEIYFVESDKRTSQKLESEVERLHAPARVVTSDVFMFLHRSEKSTFDVVFADPPFRLWSPEFASRLYASVAPWMLPGAIFLVKHPSRVLPSLPVFTVWKTSPFGESKLIYFRYDDGKADGPDQIAN